MKKSKLFPTLYSFLMISGCSTPSKTYMDSCRDWQNYYYRGAIRGIIMEENISRNAEMRELFKKFKNNLSAKEILRNMERCNNINFYNRALPTYQITPYQTQQQILGYQAPLQMDDSIPKFTTPPLPYNPK